MKRVYLDYAASTPLDENVWRVMKSYFSPSVNEKYGNAGSLHAWGQEAVNAIDDSREIIARALGTEPREVVFTSGATEANNLALRGIVNAWHKNQRHRKSLIPRVIVSAIEHVSILETTEDLEKDGLVDLVILPVKENGIVDLEKLKKALNQDTILVSIMYVNNEIGSIQPIREISNIILNFRKSLDPSGYWLYPVFHTDAVQALQFFDCDMCTLDVDLMTISAHKVYGPKGAGALCGKNIFYKSPKIIEPITTGGSQEFSIRPGTQNTPAIAGFGRAVSITLSKQKAEYRRVRELKKYFLEKIKTLSPDVHTNPRDTERNFSPHIINVSFPSMSAEDLLVKLDLRGIGISLGAACSLRVKNESHVLRALNVSEETALSSIRISFGRETEKSDIDYFVKVVREILDSKS